MATVGPNEHFPSLPTFLHSSYYSLGKLSSAPAASHDVSGEAALAAAVHERSFKGELIVFSFNFCAIPEAINAALMLRQAGFAHFMPLSDGRATCEAMRQQLARADAEAHASTPCYFASAPNSLGGWASWGGGAGCVSAEQVSPARPCAVEQLWYVRYAVAARLLRQAPRDQRPAPHWSSALFMPRTQRCTHSSCLDQRSHQHAVALTGRGERRV